MDLFKGNQGKGEAGFTLIELLVVIGILAVLAAVAIPAYSRFFGEGEVEANSSELSNIQAAMDAMMAHHRITVVDIQPKASATRIFIDEPTLTSAEALLQCGGACVKGKGKDYEPLHSAFLRIGTSANPTKCEYWWEADGFIHQIGEEDPLNLTPCITPAP